MTVVLGKEVVISIPGGDDMNEVEHHITLAPGATKESILAALNEHFGTRFMPERFTLIAREPSGGQIAFGAGENVSEQVRDGTHLWVVPADELSLG